MARKKKGTSSKPETEIRLEQIQEVYLTTRSEESWGEMFHLLIVYARSILLKVNKGKVFIPPEKVLAVATDAAMKILERYSDPEFRIEASFAGLLRYKVIESLYGKWQDEANLSLNATIGDSSSEGTNTELGDLQEKHNFSSLHVVHTTPEEAFPTAGEIQQTVVKMLQEYDTAIGDTRLSLLGRAYLLLTLRRSKVRFAAGRFLREAKLTPREEDALELLILEFHNRTKEFLLQD